MNWRSPLGIVLTVSLAANLFAAGAAIGFVLPSVLWQAESGAAASRGSLSLDDVVRTLPADGRLRAAAAIEGVRSELVDGLAAQDAARRDAAALLAAETLNPHAAGAALTALRDRTGALQASVHGVLLEIATGLAPGDRQLLSGALLLQGTRAGDDPSLIRLLPLL